MSYKHLDLDESGILQDVREEYERARTKYPPYSNLHEGYAIILEELDELWDEVKIKEELRDPGALYKEALQVASTALSFCALLKQKEVA